MSPNVTREVMTIWERLAVPFPDEEVKQRPGAAKYGHDCPNKQHANSCREIRNPECHAQFSYVDARAVAQRLDDVLTPEGWDFTCAVIPGSDIVKGSLRIHANIREDHGYPNSDRDEEPIKAATSDALKRCAVLFGVGRHLYEDNKPTTRQNGHRTRQTAPVATRPVAVAAPARSSTDLPEGPDLDWDMLSDKKPESFAQQQAGKVDPDGSWTFAQLADRAKALSVPTKVLGDTAKRLYGPNAWKLTDLTGEQRYTIAVEVGLL